MKQNPIFLLLSLSLFMMLTSCEAKKTPEEISEHFWLGIETKNIAL